MAQYRNEDLVFPNAKRLRDFEIIPEDAEVIHRIHRSPMRHPSPPHCLVVIAGADLGRWYEVAGCSTLTIGRASTSNIHLSDDSVSRTHATIIDDDDGVMLRDDGSKNGILVNGVKIRECVLSDGDVILIGRTVFALTPLVSGTTNLEISRQIACLRLQLGLPELGPVVAADTEAETEGVEHTPSASPPEG